MRYEVFLFAQSRTHGANNNQGHCPDRSITKIVKNERRAIPPVIAAIQRRLQPQLQQLK
jgi:hypothetical protein